ncbi:hypothetical protein J7337_007767 [Fusarium musae]|uniref:Uncharacterized protein n=1 Tax=Fusarium musae TaxID=1042133 RepID=A0A9P8IQM8_9HYPO|nr:hypothetical protein J7337_007767 [Fusarium musae]KAG9502055.1 hypothetical protein J7337_007767 [Fusarium musae]
MRILLTGTVVLLSACLANAGPCRPSSIVSSSTVVASASETATESETATSTASIDATQTTTGPTESESSTETGTTAIVETTSSVSSVETTTTALVDITTTTNPVTSAETTTEATTTTVAATTTTEGPETLQSIYLYSRSNDDPALADTGGIGFAVLRDSALPDVEELTFTADVSSTLFFTFSQRTGQVKIGNGPEAGKVLEYGIGGDFSSVIAVEATVGEENGIVPIDCAIVSSGGIQTLQCQFGNEGTADFWTCDARLVLVKSGVDFSNRCPIGSTGYHLDSILVSDAPENDEEATSSLVMLVPILYKEI